MHLHLPTAAPIRLSAADAYVRKTARRCARSFFTFDARPLRELPLIESLEIRLRADAALVGAYGCTLARGLTLFGVADDALDLIDTLDTVRVSHAIEENYTAFIEQNASFRLSINRLAQRISVHLEETDLAQVRELLNRTPRLVLALRTDFAPNGECLMTKLFGAVGIRRVVANAADPLFERTLSPLRRMDLLAHY